MKSHPTRDNIAISAKNISKVYKLYKDPLDRLKESLNPLKKKYHKDFYALDDLSLEVQKGETIGIIGRNGSGKSTLLQIIAGVLNPSSGSVDKRGKVLAILELGTGYNPELTGLENVYYNSMLMGLSRNDIDRKMESILKFADIGEFVHQPFKTYSSGMRLRLAFSVVANLDPDILVIDEAIAVGDIMFQTKCFRRFEELVNQGTTILFVTQSPSLIVRHCHRAIVLENGKIFFQGSPNESSSRYLDLVFGKSNSSDLNNNNQDMDIEPNLKLGKIENKIGFNKYEYRIGNSKAEIFDAIVSVSDAPHSANFYTGDEISLKIFVKYKVAINKTLAGFWIKSADGIVLYGINSSSYNLYKEEYEVVKRGDICCFVFQFKMNINTGDYLFCLGVSEYDGEMIALDWRHDVLHFNVQNKNAKPFGFTDLMATAYTNKL